MQIPKVTGIYLAAGASRRMGRPKLTIPLGSRGVTGGLAIEQALQVEKLERIVVVSRVAGYPSWLNASEEPVYLQRCSFIEAKDADLGLAHSLRAGLSAALHHSKPDAVLVMLADQPFIRAELLDQLIFEYQADRALDYVAAGDAGIGKPPVLLAASMFNALMKLQGDEGARKLLLKPGFRGKVVEAEARCFLDLDTPEDVEAILKLS
ncbi:nucleotidyltransferase family protein [Paenibacillus agricola]|uniref:nucleotidyltransferase family protein n=1 Tax=Paenibacillus agricola TaxID=2716264 RepID=UPI002892E990|nr:nucleotidyltransferase family protein [Paenibacillus agricola]